MSFFGPSSIPISSPCPDPIQACLSLGVKKLFPRVSLSKSCPATLPGPAETVDCPPQVFSLSPADKPESKPTALVAHGAPGLTRYCHTESQQPNPTTTNPETLTNPEILTNPATLKPDSRTTASPPAVRPSPSPTSHHTSKCSNTLQTLSRFQPPPSHCPPPFRSPPIRTRAAPHKPRNICLPDHAHNTMTPNSTLSNQVYQFTKPTHLHLRRHSVQVPCPVDTVLHTQQPSTLSSCDRWNALHPGKAPCRKKPRP